MEVEVLVLLSKIKNQHFAYGKMLTFYHIEFVLEGRMYEVLRLYFDLPKKGKQVVIMGPFRQEHSESLVWYPNIIRQKPRRVQKPALVKKGRLYVTSGSQAIIALLSALDPTALRPYLLVGLPLT